MTAKTKERSILFESARNRLAVLWCSFTAVILVTLVLLSFTSAFEINGSDKTEDAWDWFLPTIMPSLSLVVSGLTSVTAPLHGRGVRISSYRFAMGVSTFYLSLAIIPILIEPFTQYSILALLKRSHLWLGPLQGVVTPAIGYLFLPKLKRQEAEGKEHSEV